MAEPQLALKVVALEKPEDVNLILGQSHFIKTVEDLHEAMVGSVPGVKFAVAFCESSGPALVRWSGNDDALLDLARRNALALSAGHVFLILMQGAFPINVLSEVRRVPEVCGIYCATANPVQVIVAETAQGRGVLGVIDGEKTKGVETAEQIAERKALLRRFGYKL
jgi:adenosine/AMP kinase